MRLLVLSVLVLMSTMLVQPVFAVVDRGVSVVAVFSGVKGFGWDSDGGVVAVLSNGSIVSVCGGGVVGFVSVTDWGGVRRVFYDRSSGVLLVYRDYGNGSVGFEFYNVSGLIRVLRMGVIGRGSAPWLLHAVPCTSGGCLAVLYGGADNVTRVGVYWYTNGSFVERFPSNSLILQVVNGSVVASRLDRFNDSVIVDVVSGRDLLVFPATRPLRMFGLPLIQLLPVNSSVVAHIVFVSPSGASGFLAWPGETRFYEAVASVASSVWLRFFVVVNATSASSIVVFPDGYTVAVPIPLSVVFAESFRFREPPEGVIDVDLARHWVLARLYDNGSAAVEVVKGDWSDRIVLRRVEPGSILGLLALPCRAGDLGRVAVFDGSTVTVYSVAGGGSTGSASATGSSMGSSVSSGAGGSRGGWRPVLGVLGVVAVAVVVVAVWVRLRGRG